MKEMKILGIVSGGLDSVSMISKYKDENITLMTFNYGQKGSKELEIVHKLGKKINAEVIEIDISFMKKLYGDSNQLTSDNGDVEDDYTGSVVVPLRNAVFIQIAMTYAYSNKFDAVILGSHLGDIESIKGERAYPDCSPEFFKSMELAMDLGTKRSDGTVKILSPSILSMNKTDLIKMGYKNLGNFLFDTWSCYKSNEKQCGTCESCRNRKKAFEKANIEDKTKYLV